MRTAATRVSPRRCTTALVKCVVPIITAPTFAAAGAVASRSASARVTPPVTSAVVGVFTAAATRSPSRKTASVLVPPTSIPIRRRRAFAGLRPSTVGRTSAVFISGKYRVEVEVVAEGARADVLQSLGRQQKGRRGQGDDGHALAVAERLGADGVAGDGVEHADQVRRRHAHDAVEPADGELVLKREAEGVAAVRVQAVQRGGAPQEPLGRAPGDVLHLAGEEPQPALGIDHRLDGIAVLAPRRLHRPTQADRLGGRIEDAALLYFLAGARRLARARDGADGDAGGPRQPLHPLP